MDYMGTEWGCPNYKTLGFNGLKILHWYVYYIEKFLYVRYLKTKMIFICKGKKSKGFSVYLLVNEQK